MDERLSGGKRLGFRCPGKMLLVCVLALLSLQARTAQAGDYGDVNWYTKSILAGQVGVLGQAVRVPSSLFAKSPCQLVYLGSPDWSTSQVSVDFGAASPASGCRQQAFLVYVDGYDNPRGITGFGSKADIPWSTIVTYPANLPLPTISGDGGDGSGSSPDPRAASSSPPPSSPSSFQPPASGTSTPAANSRRRLLSAIDVMLDRQRFGSDLDNLRDLPPLMAELDDDTLIPGVGGPLSDPVLAAGYFQTSSAIPADPRVYLDVVEERLRLQANGADSGSDSLAGLLSGRLRVYTPLPAECSEVLRSRRGDAVTVSGGGGSTTSETETGLEYRLRKSGLIRDAAATSSTSSASTTDMDALWEPLTSAPVDSCFVSQQAVLIYNDCPVAAVPVPGSLSSRNANASSSSTSGSNSSSSSSSSSFLAAVDCSRAADVDAEIACLLRQSLLPVAQRMAYVPTDADVEVVVRHRPFNRCYQPAFRLLGQTGTHLILFTAGLVVLLSLVLLTPTFFRLFISFPCRAIAHAFRKWCRCGRVSSVTFDSELHSYKEPGHPGCFQWPVVRQLLGARKHLLYAMCTIHSADGQYRALQVAVTSSVALMICMMSFPPEVIPPLGHYIPPLNFRIDRVSGDPLGNVWYFLTILAYSLYLGFIGYLAMLANYNRPRNRYYLTQCVLSVFFMLVLDALVLMQVYSILLYWNRLAPKWPWLPIITFQLANLAVTNVLQVVICFSNEDRRVAASRAEYLALKDELRDREDNLQRVKKTKAAAAATAAATATAPSHHHHRADATAGQQQQQQQQQQQLQQQSVMSEPRTGTAPPAGSSLRRRAALAAQPGGGRPRMTAEASAGSSSSQPPTPQQQQQVVGVEGGDVEFDDLAAAAAAAAAAAEVSIGDAAAAEAEAEKEMMMIRTAPRPVAEGFEGGSGGVGELQQSASRRQRSGAGSSSNSSGSGGGAGGGGGVGKHPAAAAVVVSGPSMMSRGSRSSSSKFKSLRSLQARWRQRNGGSGWLRGCGWLKGKLRPLSEDAAFRYPSWLLAALLVSAYMLVFTYARAMNWAHVVGDCMTDPAECLNNNVARYLIFATRLVGRDWQVQMLQTLDAVSASQEQVQAMINGNDTTTFAAGPLESLTGNLTDALTASATSHLTSALSADVSGLLNDTLGSQLMALLPSDELAAFQARLSSAVVARVAAFNLTAAADPLLASTQSSLFRALNGSLSQFYDAIGTTSQALTVSIKVSHQLENWKRDLVARFFWCSLAGFTLGLLLGLSSLVRTAIAFRIAARKLRLATIADKIFKNQGVGGGDGDAGGGGGGASGGGTWAVKNFRSIYDEENSIVNRARATGISLVVFFFGVLLSTAIVQLYAVGVCLSVGLAIVSHPWTWTWLLPRYYMWLVAIVIALVLQKAVLISYVGNNWLSNGDRIYRPAAWLAFLVIASATNLVIGLLLAVFRIVLLLLTSIFALGQLDVSLFPMLAKLDLPHQTFLAGLHLQEAMSNFHDPVYLPGPRGRVHRRWREALCKLKVAAKLRELAAKGGCAGEGKMVEAVDDDADQVLVVVPDPSAMMAVGYEEDGLPPPSPPRTVVWTHARTGA